MSPADSLAAELRQLADQLDAGLPEWLVGNIMHAVAPVIGLVARYTTTQTPRHSDGYRCRWCDVTTLTLAELLRHRTERHPNSYSPQ